MRIIPRFPIALIAALTFGGMALLPACGKVNQTPAQHVANAEQLIENSELDAAAIELRNALKENPGFVEARILLGKVALELGDGATAEKELGRALDLGLAQAEAQHLIARAIVLQGEFDRLLEETSQLAPGISPQNVALIMSLRGQAHLMNSEFEQASENFQAALETDPTSVEALVGMSTLNGIQNDIEASREWATRALDADNSSPLAWSALGNVELTEGNLEEAEVAFTNAIEFEKYSSLDRAKRAMVRIRLGELAEAEADLDVLKNQNLDQNPYVAYVAGILSFRQGKYQEAAQEFAIAYDGNPSSMVVLIHLAETNRLLGNLEQATYYAERAYSLGPRSLASQRMLGAVQISNSELGSAKSTLEKAYSTSPDDTSTLWMLAGISNIEGETAKTVDYLEQLLEQQPDAQYARNALNIAKMLDGQALAYTPWQDEGTDRSETDDLLWAIEPFRNKNFPLALDRARQLSERDPENLHALLLISACQLAMGDWSEARKQLEEILVIEPEELSAARNLAILEARDGNLERAQSLLVPVVERRPQDEEATLLLADIESRLGGPEDAMEVLERSVERNPGARAVIVTLAQAYFVAGRYTDVVTVTGSGTDEDLIKYPRQLELRGRAQMLSGDIPAATETFELLTKAAPDSAKVRFFYADSLLKGGDRERARREIDQVVEMDPTYLPARLAQVRLLAESGNPAGALEAITDVEQQFGERPEVVGLSGWLYLLNGDYAAAEERLTSATSQIPDTVLTGYLAKALWEQGKHDQAIAVMQEWLQRYPRDLAIQLELASGYLALEKMSEARSTYASIVESYPNHVLALNNLAYLQGQKGDLEAGIRYAERAYDLSPANATVLDTLGSLLLQKGDVDTGYSYIRKAAEHSPKDQVIQLHLGDALIQNKQYDEARAVLESIIANVPSSQTAAEAKALLDSMSLK